MPTVWLLLALLTPPPAPSATDPGARAFQRCAACHSLQATASADIGPNLKGVFGRRAGAVSGFAYSDAMRAAGRRGMVWDAATLDRFLADPEAALPGTTMPYQGGTTAERAAVIAWLRRAG
ncbi:c-type cytochrome [Brevundimonas sp.]|uniref:c-type cytochrome n=1 Tax=Brevundimonas sp. TaxID=1871086 RepID=UPI003A9298FB